jgi:hypothetical protein
MMIDQELASIDFTTSLERKRRKWIGKNGMIKKQKTG